MRGYRTFRTTLGHKVRMRMSREEMCAVNATRRSMM